MAERIEKSDKDMKCGKIYLEVNFLPVEEIEVFMEKIIIPLHKKYPYIESHIGAVKNVSL